VACPHKHDGVRTRAAVPAPWPPRDTLPHIDSRPNFEDHEPGLANEVEDRLAACAAHSQEWLCHRALVGPPKFLMMQESEFRSQESVTMNQIAGIEAPFMGYPMGWFGEM